MKRDMALVREILIKLSEAQDPINAKSLANDKYSVDLVGYHFKIMNEAGLIHASFCAADNNPYYFAQAISLTWAGNDFLDSVKDDKIWKRLTSALAKTTGSATLEVIKSLASKLLYDTISVAL